MSLVRKTLAVLLTVALLAACATAEMVELNPANFHKIVKDPSKNVFVMFYAPWCGHCNNMKSTWLELADKYPIMEDVVIARVDASKYRGISKEFNVHGFPTLKFFSKKNKSGEIEYEGPRELSAFVSYVSANKQ
ncbi:protein disulfide isomerase [Leishmania mexicana MHOM/GT/2001/U1103]|uniref:Protein disulfide isomerase n=1 Tax=Leishmania mexicana (strain MHOM/GT/2001/U1103) TaxID=929439 RepID=E9AKY4_LEIMU|nr:protein disulfide isomerase [Leishmania mexicana MHOM/GT/2001/U1103]CBZ23587.1 protein disulfide isomerase [Leishmania mexicana MHOM/GT/2001/U1103]